MEQKVDIFKALADSNRLRILLMLESRDLCVCEINSVLNVSMSTISSHLKILRNAGLVISRKDGRWIIYSLNRSEPELNKLFGSIIPFLADEDLIKQDREKLTKVSPENCTSA